jgi:hypothetical protein
MPTAMISERIKYKRSTLYNIGKSVTAQGSRQNPIVMEQIKQLHIQKCKRGKRSGQINVRRTWDNNQGVNEKNLQTLPQEIPTVTQTKRISNRNFNTHNIRNIKKIKSETLNITKGQKNLKICSINPRSVKNKFVILSFQTISTLLPSPRLGLVVRWIKHGVVSFSPTDIEYSKSLVLEKQEEVVSLLFIRPI